MKKRWNDKQIVFLMENYGNMCLEDIARAVYASTTTVRNKAIELGIHHPQGKRPTQWSKEQLDYLVKRYPTDPLSDIAAHVGFSSPTVKKKAIELNLSRAPGYDVRNFRDRYVSQYRNV